MEIKPIKQVKQPNYPTFEYYVEHPELLYRNIPESWLKNKYVAASLGAFILLGSPKSKLVAQTANIEIVDRINSEEKPQNAAEQQDSIKVAPIFVHGDGSGATGCIVMSPPVFISEDDAKKIIFNALRKEGIKFDTKNCPEIQFTAPPIANSTYSIYVYEDEDGNVIDKNDKFPDAKVNLKMDGYNKEMNFSFQYVSVKDFNEFKSEERGWSSVQGYYTKKAAEIIQEKLVADGKTNAVVFYDPITRINIDFDKNNDWKKMRKDAKEEAEKLLLAQVEDFIKWLRAEGIIKK